MKKVNNPGIVVTELLQCYYIYLMKKIDRLSTLVYPEESKAQPLTGSYLL